jgi:hypothetical protein
LKIKNGKKKVKIIGHIDFGAFVKFPVFVPSLAYRLPQEEFVAFRTSYWARGAIHALPPVSDFFVGVKNISNLSP